MEVKANRLGELALDSTQAIQPQRSRALQTHILPSKKSHAVQPQLPATAGSTSPTPLPKPVPCSGAGIQSTGKSPRLVVGTTKPLQVAQTASNIQHSVITPSSTSALCTNRRSGVLQAGVQAQAVDTNRAVNTGQQGIQRTLPGKVHAADCTRPRAVVAEQLPGHRPLLWRPSTPVGVFAAMDNTDHAVHTKQSQQSKLQATYTSHWLPGTIVSGSLQAACTKYIDKTLVADVSLFVSQARETWTRCSQILSAFTSWTGSNLGRGIVECSKKYWSVQCA